MSSINKVILIGRLGKKPELRNLESGKSVANFSLATSEKYKGEEQTTWHNIVMWENVAEIAERYLDKGSLVYLEGKIQNRSYDDNDGNKRYVSEVVCFNMTMLGGKSQQQDSSQQIPDNLGNDDNELRF